MKVNLPPAGNMGIQTENKTMQTRPSQKAGMEIPRREKTRSKRSTGLFFRRAATDPSSTPKTIVKMNPRVVSSSVAGRSRLTSSHTGELVW